MNRRDLLKNSLFAGLTVTLGIKAKPASAPDVPNPCTEFGPQTVDLAPSAGRDLGSVPNVHVIAGDTKSGKTTALKEIALAWVAADPNNRVLFIHQNRRWMIDEPRITQTWGAGVGGRIFNAHINHRMDMYNRLSGNRLLVLLDQPETWTQFAEIATVDRWVVDLAERHGPPIVRTKYESGPVNVPSFQFGQQQTYTKICHNERAPNGRHWGYVDYHSSPLNGFQSKYVWSVIEGVLRKGWTA